jgi:hypothetical protein
VINHITQRIHDHDRADKKPSTISTHALKPDFVACGIPNFHRRACSGSTLLPPPDQS